MDPITALVAGGSGMVGQIGGAFLAQEFAKRNAAEAHDWSVSDAKDSRHWQEMMSNTAHQREVADLRAAGLNPILSAHGGSGSSTPSGATADADKADSPNVQIGNAVSTALEARQALENIELTRAQAGAARAQESKTKKEAGILGPKSYLYNKVEDMLKSGADFLKGSTGQSSERELFNHNKDALKQFQQLTSPRKP